MTIHHARGERVRGVVIFSFLALLLGCVAAGAQGGPGGLRLTSHMKLPVLGSPPMDIRWAGDDSLYVLWFRDGVKEVGVDGTPRQEMVPGVRALSRFEHLWHLSHLAVSPRSVAVSSLLWQTLWRPREGGENGALLEGQEIAFAHDMDLQGDRLLLLGVPVSGEPFAPDGAVAWIGTLGSKLKDLRPVLNDTGGPGVPHFFPCRSSEGKGAVRFLDDGSFLVVPGFQKGAHLFDPSGRQIYSWTSEELGLNTDCSLLSDKEEAEIPLKPAAWGHWLNTHSIVDDILPLAEGPGLLVRTMGEDGRIGWKLKVLTPGRVKTYSIPLHSRRPFARLHGDVRNGRIALLLASSGFGVSTDRADFWGEVLFAKLVEKNGEGAEKESPDPRESFFHSLVESKATAQRSTLLEKVGCSRIDSSSGGGTSPSYNGCGGSGGGCYECLYPGVGGYSMCYESPDGTTSLCIDYQL